METIRNFLKDESGANMVEYALLVALIGVMLITVLGTLKGSISDVFDYASQKLDSARPQ